MPERTHREPHGPGLDPFWAEVHRRHPDVDLVLLPGERAPGAGEPPGTAEPSAGATGQSTVDTADRTTGDGTGQSIGEPQSVDPVPVAGRCAAQVAQEWRWLVPDRPVPEPEARWVSGPTAGTVRHETTLAVTGVDPVATTATITHAADALTTAGWHVLTPAEGLPRVLAGRDDPPGPDQQSCTDAGPDQPAGPAAAPGRRELQLLLVPASGRLVLRVRSGPVAVGAETARSLVTGGAA